MSFAVLITVTVVLYIIYEIWRQSHNTHGLPRAAYSWPTPIQLILYYFNKNRINNRNFGTLVNNYRSKLGDVFVMPIFKMDCVVLLGEDATTWASKLEKDDVYTRFFQGNVARILQSSNKDINSKKEIWKKNRELLSPILMQSSALNNFIPTMVHVIQNHLSQVKVIDDKSIASIVFDIGWLFIVGKRGYDVKDMISNCYKDIKNGMMSYPIDLPGTLLRKALEARAKIADTVKKMLDNDPAAKTDTNCCLGGLSVHDNKTEFETRILGLLFAATETTFTTMNGLIWHLIENPTVLNKLQQEIRENPEPQSLSDFQKFPYLNKVIHETLRMYGVDTVFRESKVGLQYKNTYFPPGTKFAIVMGYEHQSISNPNVFDPDREEKYKWEPFGTSARNCLGKIFAMMQIKMIVVQMLKKYDVRGEKLENASIREGLSIRLKNARLHLEQDAH